MTKYGYVRVLTKGQDLESQIQALELEQVDHIYQYRHKKKNGHYLQKC